MFSAELKKGSTEMLILSLVESRARHGYEIGKLIEARSGGRIKGRWVEKAGERQRCFYRLTSEGRRVLARQRENWQAYVAAVNQVMEKGDA